jgi:hypothetical protein
MAIRDLIKEILNQGPYWKLCVIVRAEIDQIMGQIEKHWKFDDQLRVQVHKSEIKDQDENGVKLWGWWLSLAWVKLHKIKSLEDNYECN